MDNTPRFLVAAVLCAFAIYWYARRRDEASAPPPDSGVAVFDAGATGASPPGPSVAPPSAASAVDAGAAPRFRRIDPAARAALLAREAARADAVVNAADSDDRAAVEAMLDALAGSGKPFIHTSGSSVVADDARGAPSDAVFDDSIHDPGSRWTPTPDKQARADLDRAILAGAARGAGFQSVVALAGDRPEIVDAERFEAAGVEFESRTASAPALAAALATLRSGSMRVLVSDFLFAHDARELVRPLAARGGGLALVQVLGTGDARPEAGSALRLVDAESDAAHDLVLDRRTVERYLERLARLTDGLEEECRRAGARFVRVEAGTPLVAAARSLARAGILDLDGP